MELNQSQGTVLQAFSRALGREAHVLTEHPEMMWQQMHNRLQWEDELVRALVAKERDQRSIAECKPWLRTKTPFRESEGLLRTLSGHTDSVCAAAFSPDGTRTVSASWDKTLKIWDTASGQELRTLSGHTERVDAVAVNHDETRIVSGSYDKTLKVWDAASGRELHTPNRHTDIIPTVAFSPDGTLLVTASWDQTLKIWDAANFSHLFTIALPGMLNCVALHPWLPLVVCGDRGGSFYMLELVGIKYGPIIVTAVETGQGIKIRCPSCQQHLPITQSQLGSELTCPPPGYGLRLKINPFVTKIA